jgi:ATP-dependent Zn protease
MEQIMGTQAKISRLERTAYHEAGHAVAACIYHRRFRHATIVPNKEQGSLGHCLYTELHNFHPDMEQDRRTLAWIEREILVGLAGATALAHLTGRLTWEGASSDWRDAYDLAL